MKEIIVKMTGDHIKLKGGEYVQDLVRCKECHNWDDKEKFCGLIMDGHTEADDFCSYGEEKEVSTDCAWK